MKWIAVILLTICSLTAQAQRIQWGRIAVKSGLMAVSGFCDGTAEQLKVDYKQFERTFPNARPEYWNPHVSWPNKYKNGDPAQGERFRFSTTALVWTTDGYHMVRMVRNVTMMTAIVIPLNGRKNWKVYALEAVAYYVAYTGGFNLAYEIVYK